MANGLTVRDLVEKLLEYDEDEPVIFMVQGNGSIVVNGEFVVNF